MNESQQGVLPAINELLLAIIKLLLHPSTSIGYYLNLRWVRSQEKSIYLEDATSFIIIVVHFVKKDVNY